jgi:hypothetical protein
MLFLDAAKIDSESITYLDDKTRNCDLRRFKMHDARFKQKLTMLRF